MVHTNTVLVAGYNNEQCLDTKTFGMCIDNLGFRREVVHALHELFGKVSISPGPR